ncbi:hypothetical protein JTY60_01815 [symbiont of Argiope bruennichi]|uniref:hypothetical protein n=1 Tax=symbiont of Argiope bruennichi TaxID=2810479 RepID=UPI003DA29ADB
MIKLNFTKKYIILSKKWLKFILYFVIFSFFLVFISILLILILYLTNFSFYEYKNNLILFSFLNIFFIISTIFSCYFLYRQKDIISNRVIIFFNGVSVCFFAIISIIVALNLFFDETKNYLNNDFDEWKKVKNHYRDEKIKYNFFFIAFIFLFFSYFFYGLLNFYLYIQLMKIRKITLVEQWNNKIYLLTYKQLAKEFNFLEKEKKKKIVKLNNLDLKNQKKQLNKRKKAYFYKN